MIISGQNNFRKAKEVSQLWGEGMVKKLMNRQIYSRGYHCKANRKREVPRILENAVEKRVISRGFDNEIYPENPPILFCLAIGHSALY